MRLIAVLILFTLGCQARSNFQNPNASHYTGLIDKFPIEMELTNNSGQLSGWYHYPGKSIKLKLNGTLSPDLAIKLFESNHKGDVTGVFEGEITDLGEIKGRWNNVDKTKVYSFSVLRQNSVSLTQGMDRQVIQQAEEKKMYQPSKVKGFSKLAFWSVIILGSSLIVLGMYLAKYRRRAKEKPKEIHTREIIHHYHTFEGMTYSSDMDESTRKGLEFEKYVADLFGSKKEFFTIKHWSSDKITDNHVYAESNKYPDFLIEFNFPKENVKRQFAVECKYRSELNEEHIELAKDYQLANYRKFGRANRIDVFITVGIGGSPDKPDYLFTVPLKHIKQNRFHFDELKNYWCSTQKGYLFYDYKTNVIR